MGRPGSEIEGDDALDRSGSECRAAPLPLGEFPGIPFEYLEVLKTKRITDTSHFLNATGSPSQHALLAGATGIPESRIAEIRSLCDLARIRGIGPSAARGLYEAGFRSVNQVAAEDGASLQRKIEGLSGARYVAMTTLGISALNEVIRCAGTIAGSDGTFNV